ARQWRDVLERRSARDLPADSAPALREQARPASLSERRIRRARAERSLREKGLGELCGRGHMPSPLRATGRSGGCAHTLSIEDVAEALEQRVRDPVVLRGDIAARASIQS